MPPRTLGCLALLLVGASTGYAQIDPCGSNFHRSISKSQIINDEVNWAAFVPTCDTLVVSSATAFRVQKAYNERLQERYDSLIVEMEVGRSLRDSLIAVQAAFIAKQDSALRRYDSLLVRSNQLVNDATENTDRALRQLSLVKFGTIGIVAGALIGALLLK